MSLWLKRELFGIGTLAMLAVAHAEENGSYMPSALACRFLNARIAPFAHCRRFRDHQHGIVRIKSKSSAARGGGIQSKGFNFGALLQRVGS